MYATRPPPMVRPPPPPPPPNGAMYGPRPFGGGGIFGGGGGGLYGQQPRNKFFSGTSVVVISFIQLVFGILLLIAQIGLYYYCSWMAVCLVLPTFVAVILFIITSVIGIAAGVERTNGLILTLLVMSIIVVIVTPINMGLWALPGSEGGIEQYVRFSLTENTGLGVTATLAAIYWGLLFIPIIHWILFLIVICLCAMALCCPGRSCFNFGGPYGGSPYGPSPGPALGPGYNPSPVYGGYGGGPRAYPF